MPPKIKNKLQQMKLDAEQTMYSRMTTTAERHNALGRAVACSLLLQGHTPEQVLESANHPMFIGAGDRPAWIQTANFFKDLI